MLKPSAGDIKHGQSAIVNINVHVISLESGVGGNVSAEALRNEFVKKNNNNNSHKYGRYV